jgi:uncharacterized protein
MIDCSNLLITPLLFFALGFFAKIIKSDLEIPTNFIKTVSIYLMIGIGLHGGIELESAKLGLALKSVLVALLAGFIQPLFAYWILNRVGKIDKLNSAAISAHYGSVSISTFLSAIAFLQNNDIVYESYPLIMLAIMEAPAILIGLIIAQKVKDQMNHSQKSCPYKQLVKVASGALTNGSVLLLIGSMVIGWIALPSSVQTITLFYEGIFSGVLSLFLLAMGLDAASHISKFKTAGKFLISFAILMPILSGFIGALVGCKFLGFETGGTLLVAVLFASASYVAVPPAIKLAIPEANPSFYLTMSLGVTFPFNVVVGIPLYYTMVKWLIGN